ncbi:enoyl-CoA hydratase/isomerase family protein [Ramlibacter sp. G-1-2-2]|uniref:Enoyl-CoA hydratase/isomerase family protein n=1 Tax=Ramlibacter agri TaxID=2728837 RepID=A0A848GYY6_9BURK|nr:enoyl-CoA hydratase/isomerase family protein [Ramlibacter agri]NML42601.1 enoyl-CoA hydratase/isomerase family protein [Ramlibacter agri]
MLTRLTPAPGVCELRLDRPERLNALTQPLASALLEAVCAAQEDESVRVLFLTAAGRAFCAGKDRDEPPTPEFVAVLQQLAAAWVDGAKPVVAACQGWAVGASLELLLACDIVVAARDARFQLPEVNVGLFGTGGVFALLPRKVGLARAKGALLLGQPLTAEEAERWGLVWKLAEDAREEALAIATQLAQADPTVVGEIKRLLHKEALGTFSSVLAREAQAHGRLGH